MAPLGPIASLWIPSCPHTEPALMAKLAQSAWRRGETLTFLIEALVPIAPFHQGGSPAYRALSAENSRLWGETLSRAADIISFINSPRPPIPLNLRPVTTRLRLLLAKHREHLLSIRSPHPEQT